MIVLFKVFLIAVPALLCSLFQNAIAGFILGLYIGEGSIRIYETYFEKDIDNLK